MIQLSNAASIGGEIDMAYCLSDASKAAGFALWSWNAVTDALDIGELGYAMLGIPRHDRLTLETLSTHIHEPDRPKMRQAMAATRTRCGRAEVDFRIERDDQTLWINARDLGSDEGSAGQIIFGIFLDITARKHAEEARELIAAEMSHRVKNLFTIAISLTLISARSAETPADMARDLTTRLSALSGAHDLIRASDSRGILQSACLRDLMAVFLGPYDDKGVVGDRIRLSVPEMRIGTNAATTLALIIYEIATNSVKYGSLSTTDGTLEVSCIEHDGYVTIVWRERGGPKICLPQGPKGFGSKLISRSIEQQFEGSTKCDWQEDGLVITLKLNTTRLSA